MEPLWIIGIIAVVIGIVIVATVVERRAEKKRTEQFTQLAADMGFEFQATSASLLAAGLGTLPLFNRGHSRKTKNVLRKLVRGTEVILLDHQYTIGSGKNQQTHKYTVAVFHPTDRPAFPDFEMRPETWMHKLGALFGYQDIDFESHPKFSKSYLLRGTDEPAIRAEFTPAVLEFFENHSGRWSAEARSTWLALYGRGRVDPAALTQFLTDATKVYLLFAPSSTLGETGT